MKTGLARFARVSPAMVVAMIALFVALTGTAVATTSALITGKQIKNNSITGADVKNKSLTPRDFRGSVRGPRGLRGLTGATGAKGDPGPAGSIQGAPAGGDLSGSYPAPTIAAAPAPTAVAPNPSTATDPCAPPSPQAGVYCGTSTRRWLAGASGHGGIEFWRDRLGEVHIRGNASISTGAISIQGSLFYLPPGARPPATVAHPVAVGNDAGVTEPRSGLLVVYPDGQVQLFAPSSPTEDGVFVGEVEFRTDA